MQKQRILVILSLCLSLEAIAQQNPAATSVNGANTDAKAIEIADKVMMAQGGKKNWDKTHFITWNFFGVRKLVWDKWSGNVRIDNLKDGSIALLNVNTMKGKILRNGTEIMQADSVEKYLKQAKSAWINDSYWLVMPFKMKDSGVTLKYLGEEKTEAGVVSAVLQMTFENVGDTPQNRYKVWVDKDKNLVTQWAYFAKADNEKPNFIMPWLNYQQQGKIMLSGDRGQRKLTDIQVFDKISKAVFTDFAKPTL
jgi:plasmid maintenance system killer protein